MRKLIALSLMLFMTLAWAGREDDFSQGQTAYEQNDYARAANWFQRPPNKGMPLHRFTSAICTAEAKVFPKTPRRRRCGIEKRLALSFIVVVSTPARAYDLDTHRAIDDGRDVLS